MLHRVLYFLYWANGTFCLLLLWVYFFTFAIRHYACIIFIKPLAGFHIIGHFRLHCPYRDKVGKSSWYTLILPVVTIHTRNQQSNVFIVCHIHVLNDTHVCTFALDWVPWPKRCHSNRICIFHNGPQSCVQGISDSVQSCDRTRPQRWDPRSHYTRTSHTVALCHPSPEGFHRNHLHTIHTVHLEIHSNPLAVFTYYSLLLFVFVLWIEASAKWLNVHLFTVSA